MAAAAEAKMNTFVDMAACRRAVAALPGTAIRIEPLTGGDVNRVYSVDLTDGRRVVVRLRHGSDGYAPTIATLAALRGLGLPVPDVLGDGVHNNAPHIVLSWTPGIELRWALAGLKSAQKTRVAKQIVAFQRRAMTLPPGLGFGWIGVGQRAGFPTWLALVGEGRDLSAVPADLLGYLGAVRPVCFLDDITGKNVLIENGELAGLIDFDNVCYGDPLYWLALTIVGLVCDIGHDFYGDEIIRLWIQTAFERRVLGLYAALICDDFVAKLSASKPPDWLERMQIARASWWRDAIGAE